MSVLHTIVLGYVFTAAILMGQATSSSQSGESLPDNFIGFDSAPDKVVDGTVVRVRYRCSKQCQLAVEVVVSTLKKTDLVVYRRKWISSAARVYRFQQVRLSFPPSIFSQHSLFNKHIVEAENVTLRAWLDHLHDGSGPGTYHGSIVRIYKVLQIMPLSKRPTKPPTECISWSTQLMWQMTRNRIHQCPHEPGEDTVTYTECNCLAFYLDDVDVIDMLKFPLASTGEHFGLVRRFQPFIDRALERARLHAVTQPSVTVSVWIYLLKWCHKKLCGIIHHVDGKNLYDSVLMQLTDTGDVIIQTRVTTGEDEAFRAGVVLPLWKWIRLDCYIQDSKDSVHYDDTDGYIVIGGGKYMPGIHGYFGPIRYYRFGTDKVNNQLHPESILQDLDKTHRECQEMKAFTAAFLQQVTESHLPSPINAGSLGSSLKKLSSALFEQTAGKVFAVDQAQIKITSKLTSLLQTASCFGNHKASLLLATIHLSGLGNSVNQKLGHIYSLIGASGDNRFALMHAGYKHTQGIDGFPKDVDMAYSYYSNVGAQSSTDSSKVHENKQYTPEHIYLSNQEDLNSLRDKTSDVFEYIKLKAAEGDIKFQGQGVKKNYTRGFQLLEKAAEMGSIDALNGLGWYHDSILKDHKTAMKYFKQAALNGSDDGMFNLGIYHLNGKNPDSPWRNETAAFQQFLNASRFGHVAAAVEAAWYLSTGSLEGVSQDVERAVIMLKKVCEQNGHLGFMIREALQAYLQGSCLLACLSYCVANRQEAFVKYVLAAETGLGLAQSNIAHLCEGMYNLVVLAQQGCVEIEDEDAVTPCSLALLGVQMGKALRKMSQNGAQLLLAYASLLSVFVIIVIVPLQICLGQRDSSCRLNALRSRTSSVNLNRVHDGITGGTYRATGNLWLTTLNSEQWLRQAGDLAVTVSGASFDLIVLRCSRSPLVLTDLINTGRAVSRFSSVGGAMEGALIGLTRSEDHSACRVSQQPHQFLDESIIFIPRSS
ncbi:hypothetical protein PAMP_024779 [Pampus punctatissimus]